MRCLLIRTPILVTFILSNLLAFTRCFRILCVCDRTYKYRPTVDFYYSYLPGFNQHHCTHLVFSSAEFSGSDVVLRSVCCLSPEELSALKRNNPYLKILISLGNVKEGPESLITSAHNQTMQNELAYKLEEFVRLQKFDGVHLEWSNFAAKVYRSYDKTKFLNLAKAIKAVFIRSNFIVTVSLPAIKKQIDQGYMVKDLAGVVDFITIRTLDMRTGKDRKVGLSSPLFSHSNAVGDDRFLSVDWVVTYFQSLGVPADKINVAIPTYAQTFTLVSEARTDIGDAASGTGWSETVSNKSGIVSSPELCEIIKLGGRIINVPSQHGRYLVSGIQWYSYDDIYSVLEKTCYAKRKGIGGFSFWTIGLSDKDYIDNEYRCRDGPHPLIATAANVMRTPGLSICTPVNSYTFVDVPGGLYRTTTTAVEYNFYKRTLCYLQGWAFNRSDRGQFVPENHLGRYCTHIVYAYARVINNTISPNLNIDESENWRKGMYYRVIKHRNIYPHVKVLLGVGSWYEGPKGYEDVSKNAESRRLFSQHAIKYLRDRQFDGIEVNWPHLEASYKLNKVLLLQALRNAFNEEARVTGKPRLLLSTILPNHKRRIDEGYRGQLAPLINVIDFATVGTYCLHGQWNVRTGFNAPLFAGKYEQGDSTHLNVDWLVNYYSLLGLPRQLMNVGIATFGTTFTLRNASYNGVGDYAKGGGKPGEYTKRPGYLSYYEICDFIASGARTVRDWDQRAIYAVKDDQWVGYDDPYSIAEKACYISLRGYGGAAVYSLDQDDFNGLSCSDGYYPLMKRVYYRLHFHVRCSWTGLQRSGAHLGVRGNVLLCFTLLLLSPVAG